MKKPFDKRAIILQGVGVGVVASSYFFPAPFFLYELLAGITCIVLGFAWLAFDSVTFRRQVEKASMATQLEPGEQVLRAFSGGLRYSKSSRSLGKWWITDRRLIFEGVGTFDRSEPGEFQPESESVSAKVRALTFPLSDLDKAEIVQDGFLDVFIEATFATKTSRGTVESYIGIFGRRLEDILEIIREAASNTKVKGN